MEWWKPQHRPPTALCKEKRNAGTVAPSACAAEHAKLLQYVACTPIPAHLPAAVRLTRCQRETLAGLGNSNRPFLYRLFIFTKEATMNAQNKPVWFITGCSTGFGRHLARHALSLGYSTIVTARNVKQVEDIVAGHEDHALVLTLDVTVPEQITAAVEAAVKKFGRIDVLVNNAGIGYFGSFEESDLSAVRQMFEVNIWGLTQMTRAVLPTMRRQHSGTIVNISSMGGIVSFPAVSFYNGTKYAVEGLSESLALEVAPLGIKVLIVEPGPFRTDWAGRSADEAPSTIPDYDATAGARLRTMRGYSGKQPGDPERAAAIIVQTVESAQPPLRLLLGKVAVSVTRHKIDALKKNFDDWSEISESADFPQ
jgi:NAD(P)-dependent dehydrogenase (short-subunit alcohol dehydrogenase family)